MNYRHLYHAGNFADVLKHIVLMLCLDYLQRKDAALCILDVHGGAGRYDLTSEEAQKTGEWERGIGCLKDRTDAPADVALYLDLVRPDLAQGQYPGSPLLIARRLRPQDRLITAELHGETFEALQDVLKRRGNARAMQMDAYECARAHIPPVERRGLVLIDPPFEEKDEFETLARQMRQWKKRWPTGVYLLWYPIKAHLPVAALHEAARALGLPRTWYVETLVLAGRDQASIAAQVLAGRDETSIAAQILPRRQTQTFNGCGLIVMGAPYSVPERVEAMLPYLTEAMGLCETACGWLVPPS